VSLADLAFPLIRRLDPETAHRLTVRALSLGVGIPKAEANDPILATEVWGRRFSNPLGIAAGFDKHAEAMEPLLSMGFSFVEVGSITPRPQPGNPRPRVFRLLEDEAVINRYGFNSEGLDVAAKRLARYRARGASGLLGVNLGKNKESEDAASDYALGARTLAPYADYLVINVSSPNTPGLRALQSREELEQLVARVRTAIPEPAPPLLLKIAPDLAEADLQDIAAVALEQALDGLIVSNTTIQRPESLRSVHREETGGLSGRPLFEMSTTVLKTVYRLTGGRVPLIGVGGIASGEDAYRKLRAGASLIQLYTALTLHGPSLVSRIKRDLAESLRRDGLAGPAEAVGLDAVA
jgi:dihydroorotate dehydrogenase